MTRAMVRYRVKPEARAENEALVRAVYEELARTRPPGLRYATFTEPDGVTFVHVAFVDDDAPNPLTSLTAFRAFQRDLAARCDEEPVARRLDEVGSFGFLAG
jgi:quinol monooxygenase YgiN